MGTNPDNSISSHFNILIGTLIVGIILFVIYRLLLGKKSKDEYKASNSMPSTSHQKHLQADNHSKADRIIIKGHKFGIDESLAIREAIRNGNKVEAIWLIRTLPGISLKDAKDFVEKMEKSFASLPHYKDSSNAAKVLALKGNKDGKNNSIDTKSIKAEISKSQFSSFLTALESDNKIAAIKILKESTGLGVQETKELMNFILEKWSLKDITKEIVDSGIKHMIKKMIGEKVELGHEIKPKSTPSNLASTELEAINIALDNGNKIDAVRLFSDATGLGWNEAQHYVQKLEDKRKLKLNNDKLPLEIGQGETRLENDHTNHLSTDNDSITLIKDKSHHESEAILNAIASSSKIESIKLLRDATGLGLKEAKDFIENLELKLKNTSHQNDAIENVKVLLANEIKKGIGADFKKISLNNSNLDLGEMETKAIMHALQSGNKIEAIKLLRQYKGLDLKLAKDIIDSLEIKN